MNRWIVGLAVFGLALVAPAERKEWQLRNGDTMVLELRHAVLDEAYFLSKQGNPVSFPILSFDRRHQAEIVDWARRRDARLASAEISPESRFTKRFRDHMQLPQNGKLRSVDWTERAEPEYYALYYSASWCGPCRRFTPELVSRYEVLKKMHGGLFEFALISSDRTRGDAVKYMEDYQMPWFGNFNHADRRPWVRMKGNGIPHLVVVSREGHVLFSSYRNGEYVGPRDPLDRLGDILLQVNPDLNLGRSVVTPGVNLEKLREAFQLAAKEAREAEEPRPPQSVLTGFELLQPWEEAGAAEEDIRFELVICPHGTVDSIRTEPALAPEYAEVLRLQTLLWQFLPAFNEKGERVQKTVGFNLKLPLPAGALGTLTAQK